MKVIIEFDGDEERTEIDDAINGWKWKAVAWDMDQELRRLMKYDDTITGETYDRVEKLREFLRETISSYNIGLDD